MRGRLAAAKRVNQTCRSLSGAWGRVWCRIEDLAPVLESSKLDLTNGGRTKVNGPPCGGLWRGGGGGNGRDFKWCVRERENSDEAVCGGSGMVGFRGF
jgi:hypothetical protein